VIDLKAVLKRGFMFTFSAGKAFNPWSQKRTTAKEDILRKQKERKNDKRI